MTLILIPIATLALLLWLRQLEVNALRQRTVSSYGTVPAFQLTNQDGQPFGSAQFAGKIWIADFIYTTCPGPCPMISSRMSELQKPLEKTDVHLVSFTVDPEKDTPEVLRGYADKLQAEPGRWDFLTGAKSAIYKLVAQRIQTGGFRWQRCPGNSRAQHADGAGRSTWRDPRLLRRDRAGGDDQAGRRHEPSSARATEVAVAAGGDRGCRGQRPRLQINRPFRGRHLAPRRRPVASTRDIRPSAIGR